MKSPMTLSKNSILFGIGAILYLLLEILYRGRTHWTMGVLGGICFLLIGLINEYFSWETPLWLQSLAGSIIVTILEFASGCILNLWLHLNIWNYTDLPLNVLGQICLPFMLVWTALAAVAIILDDYLRYILFNEEKPHYNIL